MSELILPGVLAQRLQKIYSAMEREYMEVARQLSFSCSGCPDNCCDSYFLHHTYVEWAFLWQGFRRLPREKQQEVMDRAVHVVQVCTAELAEGRRPVVMCPLNEHGLCILYPYRLLVCRTHGVPAVMTRPDGKRLSFPGCFRCQEIVADMRRDGGVIPCVERTRLLQQLAMVENELLQEIRQRCPKVKMTIAEMLVKGPPALV